MAYLREALAQVRRGCLLCSTRGRPLFGGICTPCSDATVAEWDAQRPGQRGTPDVATRQAERLTPNGARMTPAGYFRLSNPSQE
jgi:hypothetical protein